MLLAICLFRFVNHFCGFHVIFVVCCCFTSLLLFHCAAYWVFFSWSTGELMTQWLYDMSIFNIIICMDYTLLASFLPFVSFTFLVRPLTHSLNPLFFFVFIISSRFCYFICYLALIIKSNNTKKLFTIIFWFSFAGAFFLDFIWKKRYWMQIEGKNKVMSRQEVDRTRPNSNEAVIERARAGKK